MLDRHLGLLVSSGTAVLIGLRVVLIARFDLSVAAALVSSAGFGSAAMGLLVQNLALVGPLLAMGLATTGRQMSVPADRRALYWLAAGTTLFVAPLYLAIPTAAVLAVSRGPLRRAFSNGAFVVLALALTYNLWTQDEPWLRPEVITVSVDERNSDYPVIFQDKRVVYVLESDAEWTTVLDAQRRTVRIISSANLTTRRVCTHKLSLAQRSTIALIRHMPDSSSKDRCPDSRERDPSGGVADIAAAQEGHWILSRDGQVESYNGAADLGGGLPLESTAVAIESTPDGLGYYVLSDAGEVFAFGTASFAGSLGGISTNSDLVDLAADPDGTGYWITSADGGIFAFSASFFGSLGGNGGLDLPISFVTASLDGDSYLLSTHDGMHYLFDGDPSGTPSLNRGPTDLLGVGGAAAGFYLFGSDGSVAPILGATSFGDSPEGTPRIIAASSTRSGRGYWLVDSDGRVHPFGDARP